MFSQEKNWPFPKYYGSCGRNIVESFEGRVLSDFIEKPFFERVKIQSLNH
jgi:hypothetical protein